MKLLIIYVYLLPLALDLTSLSFAEFKKLQIFATGAMAPIGQFVWLLNNKLVGKELETPVRKTFDFKDIRY